MKPTSTMRRSRELEVDSPPPSIDKWPGTVVELDPVMEPAEVFQRLCHLPHCIFLDSAQRGGSVGRYSFIAADPFEVLTAAADDSSVWTQIDRLLRRFPSSSLPELPPFQGGLAGMFGYELAHSLERLPNSEIR